MELIIIRHGEPDLSGDMTNPPLSELGQRQAAATAAQLASTPVDAVYVSPQRRAQQTSEPLLAGRAITPVTDERIAEFDYELGSYLSPASFEGLTRDEAIARFNELQGPAFQARIFAGFSDIVTNHPGHTVAVVCHGGVVNTYLRNVLECSTFFSPNHASVTRVSASRTGIRTLNTFNEHSWLTGL